MARIAFGWVLIIGFFALIFTWFQPHDELQANTTYLVDAQTLGITLRDGEPGKHDADIWQRIVSLLPYQYLSENVKRFHLYSDGKAGTLAYVQTTGSGSDSFVLAIDRTDYRKLRGPVFTATLIHEFGHILALEPGQMSQLSWGCQYLSSIGCFRQESYINHWYQAFWAGETEQAHKQALASKADRDNNLQRFYRANQEAFVTEYAATDALEDFAETFTRFVLLEESHELKSAYNGKIAFFYRYPELLSVREHIRENVHQPR